MLSIFAQEDSESMETNVKSPVASLCLACSSVKKRVRVTWVQHRESIYLFEDGVGDVGSGSGACSHNVCVDLLSRSWRQVSVTSHFGRRVVYWT